MTYETILYATTDGAARITLNRPERMNSFTQKMHEELRDALARLAAEGAGDHRRGARLLRRAGFE
jgi:2-(1,2-epoxy-1,2-dihydrophenyl)acetyl-CoA isomerase